MTHPRVSVIIPVHNGERFLGAAIESVLSQARAEPEVIVVDDGSTDGTAIVANTYKPLVQYHHQAQSGAGAARNRGVEAATGAFLAFLDADDLWTENKLAVQMRMLRYHPETDMVYGHVRQFRKASDQSGSSLSFLGAPGGVPGQHPGTMLVKRESFMRVGPFATEWVVGEFMDWHLRAVDLGLRIAMLPEVLLLRRVHDRNQGVVRRDSRNDYARILKRALDRRRAGEMKP